MQNKAQIYHAISVLISQSKAWADTVKLEFDDEISFRRVIASYELNVEIDAMKAMLEHPIETLKIIFTARCAWRQCSSEKVVSLAEDANSVTNRLYYHIALILFTPTNLRELLAVLMPNTIKMLDINIPTDTPVELSLKDQKECHQHDMPTIETTTLEKLESLSASIENVQSCVFQDAMVLCLSISPLPTLTLDWHVKCFDLLQQFNPDLTRKVYQHNASFKTLASDIQQLKGGLSPLYVLKDLIWGLRLGGKRFTGNERIAGAASMASVARFFDYYLQWPEALRIKLSPLVTGHLQLQKFEDVLMAMKPKPETPALKEEPVCVEVLSNIIDTFLKRNSDNPDVRDVPQYSKDEINTLNARYRDTNLETRQDANITVFYPTHIVCQVSKHIEINSVEHLIWFLKSASLNSYRGLFAGFIPKVIDNKVFLFDFAYALNGEIFSDDAKRAIFEAIIALDQGEEVPIYIGRLNYIYGALIGCYEQEALLEIIKEFKSATAVSIFAKYLKQVFGGLDFTRLFAEVPQQFQLAVLEGRINELSLNKVKNEGEIDELIRCIRFLPTEYRIITIITFIRVFDVSHTMAVSLVGCLAQGGLIAAMTMYFEGRGSLLKWSCSEKALKFLEVVLLTLKKQENCNFTKLIIKNNRKTLLHYLAIQSTTDDIFQMVRRIIPHEQLRQMSAMRDRWNQQMPIDYAAKGFLFVHLLRYVDREKRLAWVVDQNSHVTEALKEKKYLTVEAYIDDETLEKQTSRLMPMLLAVMIVLNEEDSFTFSRCYVARSVTVMQSLIAYYDYHKLPEYAQSNSNIIKILYLFKRSHFLGLGERDSIYQETHLIASSWEDFVKRYSVALLNDFKNEVTECFNSDNSKYRKALEYLKHLITDYDARTLNEQIFDVIDTVSRYPHEGLEFAESRIHALILYYISQVQCGKRLEALMQDNGRLLKLVLRNFLHLKLRGKIVEGILAIYELLTIKERQELFGLKIKIDEDDTVVEMCEVLGNGVCFIPETLLTSPHVAFRLFTFLTNVNIEASIQESIVNQYGMNREKCSETKAAVQATLMKHFFAVERLNINYIANIINDYYQGVVSQKFYTVDAAAHLTSERRLLLFLMKPFSEKKTLSALVQRCHSTYFIDILASEKYVYSEVKIIDKMQTQGHYYLGKRFNQLSIFAIVNDNILLLEELMQFYQYQSHLIFEYGLREGNDNVLGYMMTRNYQDHDKFGGYNVLSIVYAKALEACGSRHYMRIHSNAHLILPKLVYLSKNGIWVKTIYESLSHYHGAHLFTLLDILFKNGLKLSRLNSRMSEGDLRVLLDVVMDDYNAARDHEITLRDDRKDCILLLLECGADPSLCISVNPVNEQLKKIFPDTSDLEEMYPALIRSETATETTQIPLTLFSKHTLEENQEMPSTVKRIQNNF